MEKINGKEVYGGLRCPEDCKNKDVACQFCVDGDKFDANAQE